MKQFKLTYAAIGNFFVQLNEACYAMDHHNQKTSLIQRCKKIMK